MDTIELLKSYGATVKAGEANCFEAYFYHVDLDESQILNVSRRNDIDMLVFYCSSINDNKLKYFVSMNSLRKLGFASCKNITDESVKSIASIPGLESVSLVDTALTAKGKDVLKELAPYLKIK